MAPVPQIVAILHVLFLTCVTSYQDDCQTMATEVTIVKDIEYEHQGQRVPVSCVATITVHKCEGVCESAVTPTVHYPRFTKECRCCREGQLIDRRIQLDECFDEHGVLHPDIHPHTTIKDLQDCTCVECQN